MKKNLLIVVLLFAGGAFIGAAINNYLNPPQVIEKVTRVQIPAPPPIEKVIYKDRYVRLPYDTSKYSDALDSLASTLIECRRQLILAWEPMSFFELFGRPPITIHSVNDSVLVEFDSDRVNVTYRPLEGRSLIQMNYGGGRGTFYHTPEGRPSLPFFKGLFARVGMYSGYGEGFFNMGKKAYALQFGMTFQSEDFQLHLAPFGVAVYPYIERDLYQEAASSKAAYGWSLEGQWYFVH